MYCKIFILLFVLLILLFLLNLNHNGIETFDNNKYKIVIGGCCRDCAGYLPQILKKIKQITNFCSDFKIIIYENDSQDNTLKILEDFKDKFPNVTIISEKNITEKFPLRTHRLAYCRNKILDEIRNSGYDKTFDYFINIDLDDINLDLDVKSIKKYLDNNLGYDLGTSNHKHYYDLWALRTNKYDKNCWNKDEACEKNNRDLGNWFDNYHGSNIDKKGKPIKVLSAFDGLGIYKLKSIGKCRYNGVDDNGIEEDCEHVKFHKCMREKGNDKIYIIPFLNNI